MRTDGLPNWAEALTALLSVFTLVAVILAAIQIRHVNRQMHRELEMQYLLRFWTLMDRRSGRLKAKGRTSRADRVLLGEYLSLCEDQIQLRELGRVTNHTWRYWSRDIRAMCASDPVNNEVRGADQADYPLLRQLLSDKDYDPLDTGWVRRLYQGL